MHRIIVGEGECTKYGSGAPVDAGSYLVCSVPRNKPKEEQEKLKRSLGLIAATGGAAGKFAWLAPDEPWVHRLISGGLISHPWSESEPDWSILGIDPKVLRPWQRRAIGQAWWRMANLGSYRRGHVVGFGGGKTLFGLVLGRMVERVAVLAPRYAHFTWLSEPLKWGFPVPVVSTYESAHRLWAAGPDHAPQAVIYDECQLLANPESQRHSKLDQLTRGCEIVVGLTGGPLGGKGPLDWRWLRCIEPGCVPSGDNVFRHLWGLDTTLTEVKPGQKAYVTTKWDTDKIAAFVHPYVQTVETSDLLAHLPPIDYRVIAVPKPKDWDIIRSGAASTGTKSKRHAQLLQCTDGFVYDDLGRPIKLGDDKVRVVCELTEGMGEPVVIFAAHTAAVGYLAAALSAYGPSVIEGSTNDIPEQVERFLSGRTSVLIANARFSASLNLQERCRIVIFMSPSTKPDDRKQAIARVYRPGQMRGVVVVDLVCTGTLDERRLALVSGHETLSAEQVDELLELELSRL